MEIRPVIAEKSLCFYALVQMILEGFGFYQSNLPGTV